MFFTLTNHQCSLHFRLTWTNSRVHLTSLYEHWWHQCASLPSFVSLTHRAAILGQNHLIHKVTVNILHHEIHLVDLEAVSFHYAIMYRLPTCTKVLLLITLGDNPYRVDAKQIGQRASLLQRYLHDEQKELQALYALQALMVHMEQPASECQILRSSQDFQSHSENWAVWSGSFRLCCHIYS